LSPFYKRLVTFLCALVGREIFLAKGLSQFLEDVFQCLLSHEAPHGRQHMMREQSVSLYCSVLQRVTVCCSVLQYVAVCCSVPKENTCCSVLQCVALNCSVLQCAVSPLCSPMMCCDVCSLMRCCVSRLIHMWVPFEALRIT